ncbi:hypothetical protein HAX54_047377 [Datura stramonium]|uniref:GATA-type domain-containing protein n=1 Tax=Datura stramonium TaxID=4076 RepID=A0ABS8ST19_DATST|nr:hypothetical protein [Datura stramonium]
MAVGLDGHAHKCSLPRETPLWRTGPPGKPVLCNACGSRWRTRGSLDDYVPKHANREMSYQLPSEMKRRLLDRDDQKLEVGVEVSGQDGSSACLEGEINNISSLVSAGSSSDNCMQMEETNDKYILWNPDSVPRRKRSKLRQSILSPVDRLQRQLYNILQESDAEDISADDENILIYAQNKYIHPNEIGLGAVLLASPTTTTERTTSLSSVAEDNASCSKNVPVEKSFLINNNVLDHVAMQNETTGNEGGQANARENRLAPHHMDATSRVSGQKLYSQRARCGAKIGRPVKRPRGRPRLSTTQGRYLDKDRRSETADDSLQAWSSSLIDVPILSVNLKDSTDMSAIKGLARLKVNMENNLNEHIVEDQTADSKA